MPTERIEQFRLLNLMLKSQTHFTVFAYHQNIIIITLDHIVLKMIPQKSLETEDCCCVDEMFLVNENLHSFKRTCEDQTLAYTTQKWHSPTYNIAQKSCNLIRLLPLYSLMNPFLPLSYLL